MIEWLPLNYWHWLALCLLLLSAELAGTGGYLLWAGFAAGLTTIMVWVFPSLNWPWQLLMFSATAIISAFGWWKHQHRHPQQPNEPMLNQRSAQYVGHLFTLSDAIQNGRGRIQVDDGYWSVSAAEDMPVGHQVRVIAVEPDQTLRVESAH